jgi:hypothetical protein
MSSPGLHASARPLSAAGFRAVRRRLASVRGFRRERAARPCARLRRETRLPRQAPGTARALCVTTHLASLRRSYHAERVSRGCPAPPGS